MGRRDLNHCALTSCAAAALLAGCGGSQPPVSYKGTQLKYLAHPEAGYKLLYSFKAKPDGQYPRVRLIPFGEQLYGSTPIGGKGCGGEGCGLIFAVTKTGKEIPLHHFHGVPDGSRPMAELAVAKDKLYGTTDFGGASCRNGAIKNGCGTVFELAASGAERVIYRFQDIPDGAHPQGSLTLVNGRFYGTTASGGMKCPYEHGGCGTVYSVDASGKERVIYRFKGTPDGAGPAGNLVAVNGILYGTTYQGGANRSGTVFSVTPSGKEQVIYSTGAGHYDWYSPSGLVAVDGVLYGEAGGGAHEGGVLYSMTTSGDAGIVHAFSSEHPLKGDGPKGRLIAVGGVLYGTTETGGERGAGGYGSVFSLTVSGALTTLYRFKSTPDGSYPDAGVSDAKGTLYGTTVEGGTGCYHYGCNGGYGTIFRISR